MDLSACAHWLRVCQVTYVRAPPAPAGASGAAGDAAAAPSSNGGGVALSSSLADPSLREVVVLFAAVPDACVAGPDSWPEEARQQQAFKQQRLALEAEARKKVRAAGVGRGCRVPYGGPGARSETGEDRCAVGGRHRASVRGSVPVFLPDG